MKYDFSTIMDRRGKDSIAVDTIPFPNAKIRDGFDRIPMWVADMNFQTAPSIPEAVIERTKHTAYGYFTPRKEYYDAIIDWQRTRNNVLGLTEECIGYENGVLGGVISALNVFCSRGDKVLLHAPTYIGFSHSLENNGYQIIHSPLRQDDINYAWNYIQTKFEGVSAARPEGTYMLLLDCQKWCEKHDKTMDELQKAVVEEAFDRLDRYVFNVKSL